MVLEIYADGCDLEQTKKFYDIVDGYTTNPTLMKKAGITDYRKFIIDFLNIAKDKPVSFMIPPRNDLSMVYDALAISSSVYIKVPIINRNGESNVQLIEYLSHIGAKVNITSVFTKAQIKRISRYHFENDIIVSIFCGRIGNVGIDPESIIKYGKRTLPKHIKILWASSRELFNVIQAERCGCDIITLDYELLNKLDLIGKDLNEYCIETVKMFYNDIERYVV